jgi:hypothetical protein
VLQIAKLLTERRLLHMKSRRSASDASFFRNGYEVAQMPQLHPCHTLKI